MPQPAHVTALAPADEATLPEDLRPYFQKCRDKLGFVPNVLQAWLIRPERLRNFIRLYDELMLAPLGLTKLEREMIAVAVSFLAAFSFSRFKPAGTDFLMFLLLSIRMLPGSAAILPVYLMYVGFGWKDTYAGMILFYAMFSIPFSVWILKGFIDGVSPRFDETGRVNGASWLRIITRTILPQVMPGVIAAPIYYAYLKHELEAGGLI